MHKKLDSVLDTNFEVLREYINTGKSEALNEETKHMLEICQQCYALLRDFPQRNICIRKLQAKYEPPMPYTTAARYVDFARQTWGDYIDCKREFLETFFLERLMKEITDPRVSDSVRAKNLSTMQKYLERQPADHIDPKVMESNTVNIQINLGNKSFYLDQKVLASLPQAVRQQILDAIDDNIDDDGAVALLNN